MSSLYQNLRAGVYDDIPEGEYHKIPYCSKSNMKLLMDSPAHLKKSIDGEYSLDSDAVRLGSIFDAYLLDKGLYDGIERADKCQSVLKSGDRKGECCGAAPSGKYRGLWLCGKHCKGQGDPEKVSEYILPGEEKIMEDMHKSMFMNPNANKVLRGIQKRQLTIIWEHEKTGMMCKARIDGLSEYDGIACAWDLKTTGSTTLRQFKYIASDMAYWLQAFHYLDGCAALDKALGRPVRNRMFMFVVVGTVPDKVIGEYPVYTAEYDYDELQETRGFRDKLLQKWKDCSDANEWKTRNELAVTEQLYVPDYARVG